MIKGVIYKYISPNGGIYIGQTINECHRRGLFFNAIHYGGYKIDKARKVFGPENFIYERLFIEEFKNKKDAKLILDKLEAQFITQYDSINSGYNSYHGTNLDIVTIPSITKSYISKGLSPVKYPDIDNIKKYKVKAVNQYDLQENFIATYRSLSEASRQTKMNLGHISNCCKGKQKRVSSFIFKYCDEI